MARYVIEGGTPLNGSVNIAGNKNAALPCIAASLLTEEEVCLKNVPVINDVQVILRIVQELGARVEQGSEGEYRICAKNLNTSQVPVDLAKNIRASILFAGPLLMRTGEAIFPPPGGDVIGRRRLDTHFLSLSELGVQVKANTTFHLTVNKLKGAELFLDEASVTATENSIMAAVCAEGTTLIENAASEPHVQDLCRMLNAMGARISGVGSNILRIEGVKKLHGVEFSIGADFMEIGSFVGLAAVTRSELIMHNVQPEYLKMIRIAFRRLGVHWTCEGNSLHVSGQQPLKILPDLGDAVPKIDDAPWPGFPPDLISVALVVATQAEGTVLIHEKMFESRMFFVDKLISMGGRIVLCDPHRAVVNGPSHLSGSELVSPDVRAGMALVVAALCATGTSIIHNIYQIERGYENIHERLRSIGARIERYET